MGVGRLTMGADVGADGISLSIQKCALCLLRNPCKQNSGCKNRHWNCHPQMTMQPFPGVTYPWPTCTWPTTSPSRAAAAEQAPAQEQVLATSNI